MQAMLSLALSSLASSSARSFITTMLALTNNTG